MNANLQYDYDRTSPEDLEAADDMVCRLVEGTFYQREVDALRAMGHHGTAFRLVNRLREQGIEVK